jgi:hypothetical protein
MWYRRIAFRGPITRNLCRLALGSLVLLLFACGSGNDAQPLRPTRPVATLFPTVPAASTPPSAHSDASVADTGWLDSHTGIAVRHIRVVAEPDHPAIPLVIVRIDPANVRLRVAYAPDRPRSLRSWFDDEQPLLAVNGSFFTEQNQATALIVSDGVASGTSYQGFGGMLSVAQDGRVSLQSLRDQPYDPAGAPRQALQSFPMLVFPGGTPAGIEDNGQRARRTAVALDRAARLLVIVSPTSSFTLRGLAEWLSQSDLDVDQALNLDGGSSTGLFIKAGSLSEAIDSLGPLPIVLLVEPK